MGQAFCFYDGQTKICVRPLNLRERFFIGFGVYQIYE